MAIIDAFIAELQQESIGTRKTLERVPEKDFDWRPHEKSFTMGLLAAHVSEIPGYITEVLKKDELSFEPGEYKPFKPATTAEMLEHHDKLVAAAIEAMRGVPDEHLMKNWRLVSGGKVFFDLPRVTVLRTMVMNHLVHHRAQLTVYLRMRDIPVPGLYGPSADES